MNYSYESITIEAARPGLVDLWNAPMVRGANFSAHNDLPLCPTTAVSIPKALIGYAEAKTIHNKNIRAGHFEYHIDAFVHFYTDDINFDGKQSSIWLYPDKAFDVLRHFSGIITPDFSTYQDFPFPLKIWNTYRMRAFGYWYGTLCGGEVINNVRWGTPETYSYCFDSIPKNSIVAIGTVGGNPRKLVDRTRFEEGLAEMVRVLAPHTIIVYGSAKYECFKQLEMQGITILAYPSKTSVWYAGRAE